MWNSSCREKDFGRFGSMVTSYSSDVPNRKLPKLVSSPNQDVPKYIGFTLFMSDIKSGLEEKRKVKKGVFPYVP
jgi:hypothetical protein